MLLSYTAIIKELYECISSASINYMTDTWVLRATFTMAKSRSAIFAVRMYRLESIFPRLFNMPAKLGWSAGVSLTASSALTMAKSRSVPCVHTAS
jgi:hypothetical protein